MYTPEQAAERAYNAYHASRCEPLKSAHVNTDAQQAQHALWVSLTPAEKEAWIAVVNEVKDQVLSDRSAPTIAAPEHVNTRAEQRRDDAADKKREDAEDETEHKKAKAHSR